MLFAKVFNHNNIVEMFGTIGCRQKAPPLFCVLVLLFVKNIGYSILSLRIIPVMSGILSLILFFFVLKNNIKSYIAVLTGTYLFATSPILIYYSNEFKCYSCDVLICVFLLFIYKYISFKKTNFNNFLKIIFYSIASV